MEPTQQPTNGEQTQYDSPQESSLQEYVTIILRGKWVIALSLAIVTIATAFFTFRAKPVYESASMVLIDMKQKQGNLPFLDLLGTSSTNKITNELETLKSRSMAESVAKLLVEKLYLADATGKRMIPLIQEMADGEPVNKPAEIPEITKRLLKNVEFTPIRDSDIIKITARSTSPVEAALLANTYTEAYADRNLNTSRVRSRAVREFLQSQLEAKHQSLDTTEQLLQSYMRSSGMVDLDVDTKKIVDQLSQLEASRDAIEVDIKSRSKTLNSYKEELATQEPNVARAIGESNDAYIRLLQDQLAKLEVQRDVTIAQNPAYVGQGLYSEKLKEIDAQIASLKKNLQARTQTFLTQLLPGDAASSSKDGGTAGFLANVKAKIIEQQIELDGLAAREGALNLVIAEYEKQFNQIPQKSIELAKLQRARLSSEKLYLLVEEKFNEAAITETSEFGYVNIMDPAAVPLEPVSPKVAQNIILGALVGLFLGVALVMVRAYMDDRIRTPEDLKRYGYTPLSAINQMQWDHKRKSNGQMEPFDAGGKPFDIHMVSFFNPFSPLAEAYRHLRTNVQYAQVDKPLKSLLVTSASPKEGKSTTICNLAVTFAQTESRVLLIDADMRRPTVHTQFGLQKDPGLTDLLFGKSTFEEVVHENVLDNFDIICCGTTPPNPAEILGSRKMKEFIEFVSARYDVVLFDSPPLLAVTDASVLARAVDGAILIASAGNTRIGALERASEFLASVGRKSLGVVLNNFDVQKAYGGYYGYQRYGHYGYGYGYHQTKEKVS